MEARTVDDVIVRELEFYILLIQIKANSCLQLNIKKTHTTPYHPQSDGMAQRFNTRKNAQNWYE